VNASAMLPWGPAVMRRITQKTRLRHCAGVNVATPASTPACTVLYQKCALKMQVQNFAAIVHSHLAATQSIAGVFSAIGISA
jgi:hypothetical protein